MPQWRRFLYSFDVMRRNGSGCYHLGNGYCINFATMSVESSLADIREDRFRLIQRGTFNEGTDFDCFAAHGSGSLISLDYMGCAEFEFSEVPNSLYRMFSKYGEYHYHVFEDIKDNYGRPFVCFCSILSAKRIHSELQRYIEEHYPLKGYCTLHVHLTGGHELLKRKDVFWCIDDNVVGDWIGWFKPNIMNTFKRCIDNEFEKWASQNLSEDE